MKNTTPSLDDQTVSLTPKGETVVCLMQLRRLLVDLTDADRDDVVDLVHDVLDTLSVAA